jgi:glycosyltransferase involved in cell wall biosynthesis
MRILVFHGYLLGGTGSNVYNARLAAALVALGHEVHLLCQERHPERHPFIDAAGTWERGSLRVHTLPGHDGEHVRCTLYRPDIGSLLPVYVADRYEGLEARTFAECSDAQLAAYINANVAAVREVQSRARPAVALANHLVMGPAILARALARQPGVPYAVAIHGSALEYTVKPDPERFLPYAREGVAPARCLLVGSRHTAASLWDVLGDTSLAQRTRLRPPGVDVERFAAREPDRARAGVGALTARLRARAARQATASPGASDRDAFARDDAAAARALGCLDLARDRVVAFVGKLIVSKGVDLLIAAWPLVLERIPAARLVVVGFGAYRSGLESLLAALSAGDLQRAREIALAGRSLEDQPASERAGRSGEPPLRHLLAFLDGLVDDERARYLAAARALSGRVLWTGAVDHEELGELLPVCEAVVVPSTFPEAFGMVAAEAAACGALPISAAHSGLAEVAAALAGAVPAAVVPLLSFPIDDRAVRALAERVVGWLQADRALRAETRAGLVATARARWSWEGVARDVIAAASGELGGLTEP